MMFKKLVAVEPVNLTRKAQKELEQYAEKVLFYEDIPKNEEEIIKRIGDADGVLVSYTSPIGRNVLESCPNVRYVGMCCSLYSEESANVDIAYAREHGIQVLGIRDYGDRGHNRSEEKTARPSAGQSPDTEDSDDESLRPKSKADSLRLHKDSPPVPEPARLPLWLSFHSPRPDPDRIPFLRLASWFSFLPAVFFSYSSIRSK